MLLREVLLKLCRVSMHFKCSGRLFHSFTALNKNDRWPVAVLQKGTSNVFPCIALKKNWPLTQYWFSYLSQSWSHFVRQSSSNNHHISLALNIAKVWSAVSKCTKLCSVSKLQKFVTLQCHFTSQWDIGRDWNK